MGRLHVAIGVYAREFAADHLIRYLTIIAIAGLIFSLCWPSLAYGQHRRSVSPDGRSHPTPPEPPEFIRSGATGDGYFQRHDPSTMKATVIIDSQSNTNSLLYVWRTRVRDRVSYDCLITTLAIPPRNQRSTIPFSLTKFNKSDYIMFEWRGGVYTMTFELRDKASGDLLESPPFQLLPATNVWRPDPWIGSSVVDCSVN